MGKSVRLKETDIAFSLNLDVLPGMLAALNSVVSNCADPEGLRFHIAVPPEEYADFEKALELSFPRPAFAWRLSAFSAPAFLDEYLENKFKPLDSSRRNCRRMQYARLFLGDIFPGLGRIIYLDCDVIVLDDIRGLGEETVLDARSFLAAVPHFFPSVFYFRKPLKALQEIRAIRKPFNSGVLLTDFRCWDSHLYDRLRFYLDWDADNNYRLLNLGDETLLNLLFKNYIRLDRRWNRCGFGNQRPLARLLQNRLSDTAVIHWSGSHYKPWRDEGAICAHIWRQYALPIPERYKDP